MRLPARSSAWLPLSCVPQHLTSSAEKLFHAANQLARRHCAFVRHRSDDFVSQASLAIDEKRFRISGYTILRTDHTARIEQYFEFYRRSREKIAHKLCVLVAGDAEHDEPAIRILLGDA